MKKTLAQQREAQEFAKRMQSGEIPTTEENIKKLCKMAGVRLSKPEWKNGKLVFRTRRAKDPSCKYYRPSELAKMVGESRSTVSRKFKGKPGVRIRTFGGPNRKTVRMMLISVEAAKREYPALD